MNDDAHFRDEGAVLGTTSELPKMTPGEVQSEHLNPCP